jgi:hypothetical protein
VNSERIRDRFMPWAGLALGTTGFFIAHQVGSDATFQDCRAGSPGIILVATIVGIALVTLGALASWRIYGGDSETPARRTVAIVGVMACAIFALAIILPFLASLVIPRCWA